MSKRFNVAIVGATGAVGRQLLEILEERQFPVQELRLLASEQSDGEFLEFDGASVLVQKLAADSFAGIDIALFATGAACSAAVAPQATAAGAVVIDLSHAFRLDAEVPLVVPEVNPEALAGYRQKGMVASPGCAATALALAVKPLHDCSPLRRLVVADYRPVSESGQKGIDELRIQCGELLNGRPVEAKVYPHQIAFNCLPQCGDLDAAGDSRDELQLLGEARKILAAAALRITATAVQVPVFYGYSAALNVETAGPIPVAKARELLAAAPGVELLDEPAESVYPMPVEAAGQDGVLIGRLRGDASCANGLNLWLATDNLRKGAATNAVQIAELLIANYL